MGGFVTSPLVDERRFWRREPPFFGASLWHGPRLAPACVAEPREPEHHHHPRGRLGDRHLKRRDDIVAVTVGVQE